MSNEKEMTLNELLAKEAETHDSHIQFLLGRYYEEQEDYENSFKWCKLAADQGNSDGQCSIANAYFYGEGVEQDYEEALKWCKLAVNQDNASAQVLISYMYYNGEGVEQDYEEAFKWCKLAADQDNASAQTLIGFMYYNGEGVEQDYEEALKWYKLAAEQGHADAQYSLANCYENGLGVEEDYEEAINWFSKGAENGNSSSLYELGKLYYQGKGCIQDKAKADELFNEYAENEIYFYTIVDFYSEEENFEKVFEWFSKGAENGNSRSLYELGKLYYQGKGCIQDKTKAEELFTKYGTLDDDLCDDNMYDIACFYSEHADFEKAFKWFKRGFEEIGQASSAFGLAKLYYRGEGCEQNKEKAEEYFNKSVDYYYEEDSSLCDFIGDFYKDEGDYEMAIKWYSRAVDKGSEEAKEKLEELKRRKQI